MESGPWTYAYWAIAFFMWVAMMVAMMLPSASPMVLLYGRVVRHAEAKGHLTNAEAATASFAAGYLTLTCYDFFALTQVLPHLRAEWALDKKEVSFMLGFINIGTVLAYLLVRRADRWGRRRVLAITIVGYTLMTGLSGLSPNVYVFAACQMLARIFLIGEWATSMVIAAEEFPAERRGMVLGVISASAGLGSSRPLGSNAPTDPANERVDFIKARE